MFKAIVLSTGLVAASAGALMGCASPSDVSQSADGAAEQAATTAENATSNVASDVAVWYHHPGFNGRLHREFRRDVRRDERRDVRRDAARVAARRVAGDRRGWFERARAWWRS